jgi:hypothetical protein
MFFAAVLSTAALFAACGDDGDDVNNNADNYDGADAEVASLVDDFANAGRDGDGTAICEEFLTPDLVATIEDQAGQGCPSEFQEELEEDEYELEIDSLEVEEDAATVGVTDQEDRSTVINAERADGEWRIASFTSE